MNVVPILSSQVISITENNKEMLLKVFKLLFKSTLKEQIVKDFMERIEEKTEEDVYKKLLFCIFNKRILWIKRTRYKSLRKLSVEDKKNVLDIVLSIEHNDIFKDVELDKGLKKKLGIDKCGHTFKEQKIQILKDLFFSGKQDWLAKFINFFSTNKEKEYLSVFDKAKLVTKYSDKFFELEAESITPTEYWKVLIESMDNADTMFLFFLLALIEEENDSLDSRIYSIVISQIIESTKDNKIKKIKKMKSQLQKQQKEMIEKGSNKDNLNITERMLDICESISQVKKNNKLKQSEIARLCEEKLQKTLEDRKKKSLDEIQKVKSNNNDDVLSVVLNVLQVKCKALKTSIDTKTYKNRKGKDVKYKEDDINEMKEELKSTEQKTLQVLAIKRKQNDVEQELLSKMQKLAINTGLLHQLKRDKNKEATEKEIQELKKEIQELKKEKKEMEINMQEILSKKTSMLVKQPSTVLKTENNHKALPSSEGKEINSELKVTMRKAVKVVDLKENASKFDSDLKKTVREKYNTYEQGYITDSQKTVRSISDQKLVVTSNLRNKEEANSADDKSMSSKKSKIDESQSSINLDKEENKERPQEKKKAKRAIVSEGEKDKVLREQLLSNRSLEVKKIKLDKLGDLSNEDIVESRKSIKSKKGNEREVELSQVSMASKDGEGSNVTKEVSEYSGLEQRHEERGDMLDSKHQENKQKTIKIINSFNDGEGLSVDEDQERVFKRIMGDDEKSELRQKTDINSLHNKENSFNTRLANLDISIRNSFKMKSSEVAEDSFAFHEKEVKDKKLLREDNDANKQQQNSIVINNGIVKIYESQSEEVYDLIGLQYLANKDGKLITDVTYNSIQGRVDSRNTQVAQRHEFKFKYDYNNNLYMKLEKSENSIKIIEYTRYEIVEEKGKRVEYKLTQIFECAQITRGKMIFNCIKQIFGEKGVEKETMNSDSSRKHFINKFGENDQVQIKLDLFKDNMNNDFQGIEITGSGDVDNSIANIAANSGNSGNRSLRDFHNISKNKTQDNEIESSSAPFQSAYVEKILNLECGFKYEDEKTNEVYNNVRMKNDHGLGEKGLRSEAISNEFIGTQQVLNKKLAQTGLLKEGDNAYQKELVQEDNEIKDALDLINNSKYVGNTQIRINIIINFLQSISQFVDSRNTFINYLDEIISDIIDKQGKFKYVELENKIEQECNLSKIQLYIIKKFLDEQEVQDNSQKIMCSSQRRTGESSENEVAKSIFLGLIEVEIEGMYQASIQAAEDIKTIVKSYGINIGDSASYVSSDAEISKDINHNREKLLAFDNQLEKIICDIFRKDHFNYLIKKEKFMEENMAKVKKLCQSILTTINDCIQEIKKEIDENELLHYLEEQYKDIELCLKNYKDVCDNIELEDMKNKKNFFLYVQQNISNYTIEKIQDINNKTMIKIKDINNKTMITIEDINNDCTEVFDLKQLDNTSGVYKSDIDLNKIDKELLTLLDDDNSKYDDISQLSDSAFIESAGMQELLCVKGNETLLKNDNEITL